MIKRFIPRILIFVEITTTILLLNTNYAREITIKYIGDYHIELKEDTNAFYDPTAGTNILKLNNINMQVMRDFLNRFKNVSNER